MKYPAKLCGWMMVVAVFCLSATKIVHAEILYVDDYTDVEAYFERVGFTIKRWQEGSREVPNFIFDKVGGNWRNRAVHEIDVKTKKRLFFRALSAPALKANLIVQKERDKLLSILSKKQPLTTEENEWLQALALRYRVVKDKSGVLSQEQLQALKKRVDIIPLSLLLAQSAEESGWGTSRFTAEGNSLFGQWTWGANAMKPKQQRKELGDYGLAAYDTVLDAINAYIFNLNVGGAYNDLRNIRAGMRQRGEDVRGLAMVEGLLKYSERGQDYIDGIKAIMRVNKLADADFAYLADEEEVHIKRKVEY